jgi:hypothetical protein
LLLLDLINPVVNGFIGFDRVGGFAFGEQANAEGLSGQSN